MKRLFLMAFALSVCSLLSAQNASPPSPLNQVGRTLFLLVRIAPDDKPELVLSHAQAQAILPYLKTWRDGPDPGPAQADKIVAGIQGVLTAAQKDYKPSWGGKGGHERANQGNGSATPEERRQKMLDRLIDSLESL